MKPLVAGALLLAALPAPGMSRIEKLGRVLALEDRRTPGDGELERYLRDADRGVRRRAALAAGRIADAALVPALVELMNDAEPEVRQMSAFAMGLIGDRRAAERLVASLKDADATVRARAAEALGRLGDPRFAADVARMVLDAVPKGVPLLTVRGDDPGSATDPWLELRLGLCALARLKDVRAAESALLLAGKPRFDWWAAVYVAARVESPALRPLLFASASSNDPLSRALAARGLSSVKDPKALDLLAALSGDPDESVAATAMRGLAASGDPRGVPPVSAALASKSLLLQWQALEALGTLPPDAALRGKVVAHVGDPQPWMRAAALRALAHLDRENLALVLSGLDPDPAWFVRAELASALGDSSGDEIGSGILTSMLKDEDVRVLPSVLEALRRAHGAGALDVLKGHLEHPDVAVRAAAADNLAALRAGGLSAALASAYRRSLADADVDARVSLLAALGVQKDEAARAALREAAGSDPSRALRVQAAAALLVLAENPPPSGAEAVERPALDYREAMRPYDPVPGLSLYTPRAVVETTLGRIEIHLNIVEAPLSCASFMRLARRGFYDGLGFDQVLPGALVQGGSPRGDGTGGPGYTLRDELGQKPFGRGAVGMALSGKDTGGSRFFIALSPSPDLDGRYTVIGWVASGMDVVDRLRPGDAIDRIEIWDGR